jgi:hypothetical protein
VYTCLSDCLEEIDTMTWIQALTEIVFIVAPALIIALLLSRASSTQNPR